MLAVVGVFIAMHGGGVLWGYGGQMGSVRGTEDCGKRQRIGEGDRSGDGSNN